MTRSRILQVLVWGTCALLPLTFLALFFAWPASALILRGFTDANGAWDIGSARHVFADARTWQVVGRTLAMAAAGTFLSVLLGIPGAYVLYRCRFTGRAIVRGIVVIPFVLPTVVVGVAFRSVLAPGGWLGFLHADGTVAAVIAAMVFFNYSLVVRTVGSFWARLDPRAEEAARALGASPLRAWWTVTLPALTPALSAAASIVFLYCATAFGIVLILGGSSLTTVESEIYLLTTQFLDLSGASVLSIVQLVIVTLALVAAGWARRRGERSLALRSEAADHPLRLRDLPTASLTGLVVLVLICVPMAGLLWRSLHVKGQWTWANYRALTSADISQALRISPLASLGVSLSTALCAALIALAVGLPTVLIVSRRPRGAWAARAVAAIDAVLMLPLGVSAVTVGFGFLITLGSLPIDLRFSWWLVPIAQAVVAIPLIVRVLAPPLRAISPRQHEAAAALGAAPLRVLATIDGAHILRSLGTAWGFAYATSLGEFGATSFLARGEYSTLPVAIYRLMARPGAAEQGAAMAASVLLALTAAAVMVIIEYSRPSTVGELA